MNRCSSWTLLRRHLAPTLIAVCAALTAPALLAQYSVRPFPPNALRGTMQITQPPELLMDGVAMRLAPGARIKNLDNMIVVSGSLAGQSLIVNYVRDAQGQVRDVWLLNTTEAQQPMASAAPASNIVSQYDTAPADDTSKASTDLNSSTQP